MQLQFELNWFGKSSTVDSQIFERVMLLVSNSNNEVILGIGIVKPREEWHKMSNIDKSVTWSVYCWSKYAACMMHQDLSALQQLVICY